MKTTLLFFALIILSFRGFAQTEEVRYKPSFKINVCESASDKFLCEALVKGRELLEQQINCEVNQKYIQKSWDGTLLTNPDSYYVRVEKNTEAYYKIKSNGKLGSKQRHPDFKNSVYATASWYDMPLAVLTKGVFEKTDSDNPEVVSYKFYANKALTLEHTHLWTDRVQSGIYGQIDFDYKSKLIRRIRFKHNITQKEREKHRFRYVEEETVFGNPVGVEEFNPVPVKFWSKMDFAGSRVLIEVEYSNYKIFLSDVVFKSEDGPEALSDTVLKRDFRIRVDLEKPAPLVTTPHKRENNTVDPKPLYDRIKAITSKFLVVYKGIPNREQYRQCTTFLYEVREEELLFLTNEHCLIGFISGKVINEVESIKVNLDNVYHLGSDVAVIKVKSKNKGWRNFNTGFQFTSAELGDTLLTVGFPQDIYTEGVGKVVDMLNAKDGEIQVIGAKVLDLPSQFGASGSAIFDKYFRLAGLRFSGTNKNTQNATYAACDKCNYSLFVDGKIVYNLLKENNLIFR